MRWTGGKLGADGLHVAAPADVMRRLAAGDAERLEAEQP